MSFWRLYVEIIIPMMKFTFLTCAILLSLGVVKTYDIVLAMTNGGPGTSTWTPAYFTINAYSTRSNIGYASAAAVIMLLITAAIFLPLVLLTAWQARRREAPLDEHGARLQSRRRATALAERARLSAQEAAHPRLVDRHHRLPHACARRSSACRSTW